MFKSIMHIAYFCDDIDKIVDFYVNKMGGKIKSKTLYNEYLNRPDRKELYEIALKTPNALFNVYIEMAPGQFIEVFPKREDQVKDLPYQSRTGFFHFALLCDDIFEKRKELEANGVVFDTDITKGPSETYNMWCTDPEGNRFEIMQFTEKSYQVIGHFSEEV